MGTNLVSTLVSITIVTKARKLTLSVRKPNLAPVVRLVELNRVSVAAPDISRAVRLSIRHVVGRDHVLVPESDVTGGLSWLLPDLVDENPDAGLGRRGESDASCEMGGELHGALSVECRCMLYDDV